MGAFVLVLTALFTSACTDAAAPAGTRAPLAFSIDPDTGPRLPAVDDAIARYVRAGAVAGVAALVLHDGRVIHRAAYGFRASGSGAPLRIGDRFRIASMTKPVVSVAALILAERGALHLDDPVAQYLPAFAQTGVYDGVGRTRPVLTPMTIRHLLTHTSGITSGNYSTPVDALYRLSGGPPAETLAELADALAELPLVADPGSLWLYGHSTNVLGRVLEVASGEPLDALLQRDVFGPLGMTHTGFSLPGDAGDTLVAAHSLGGDGLPVVIREVRSSTTHPAFLSANGGLISTLDDYAKFAQMLVDGGRAGATRLLSEASVAEMMRNQLQPPLVASGTASLGLPGQGFGLGVAVVLNAAQASHYASAGTVHWAGAWNTYFWVDRAARVAGVVLMQFEPLGAYPVDREVGAAVYRAIGRAP